MKKFAFFVALLLLPFLAGGQSSDPLVSKCAMNAGPNTTYLKDFRVQLGKGSPQTEFRYKQVFPLSKNMKYRFTLCNADNSSGQLIMRLKDETGRVVLQSYDTKTGKTFNTVEFTCFKTGTYQIYFDFRDFSQGLGVGVVSL
ncbi:MAG: hypothetical protein U0X39_06815 [Bacteroidales bacterium]